MEFSISIFLDTRREKGKDVYPVKLRVYSNRLKKAKLYPVDMDLTNEYGKLKDLELNIRKRG